MSELHIEVSEAEQGFKKTFSHSFHFTVSLTLKTYLLLTEIIKRAVQYLKASLITKLEFLSSKQCLYWEASLLGNNITWDN